MNATEACHSIKNILFALTEAERFALWDGLSVSIRSTNKSLGRTIGEVYQWQEKYRCEVINDKKEQILDMACGRVILFQRKHYGRRSLTFDTKDMMTFPV